MKDYHGTYVIGGEKTKAGRNCIIPIRPEGSRHFEYFAKQATDELLISGYVGQHVLKNFKKLDYYSLLDSLRIARKSPMLPGIHTQAVQTGRYAPRDPSKDFGSRGLQHYGQCLCPYGHSGAYHGS